jgi:sigma-E factor negative regulatory protein RseA
MSNDHDLEQLSALVDGDLQGAERERLLRQLEAEPALRAQWARFHLIRDLLRGEAASVASRDVAARVRERLAGEPAVLAPRHWRRGPVQPWLRPALGLAAAASFGAAVVMLLPRAQGPAQPAVPAVAAVAPERPVEWRVVEQVPVTRWQARNPAVESDLHRFLADHSEFAATGVQGAMPLATLVGYDARR